MDNTVCIVGMGAVTSVGLNAPASAAAVRAGISGFSEHPFMINQEGDPYILAMMPGNDSSLGTQRYIDMALPAIEEALFPLFDLCADVGRIPVIIGSPEKRPGLPDELSVILKETIGKSLHKHSIVADISIESKGHSAGLIALQKGAQYISERSVRFCLVGGIDSYIDPDTLDWVEVNEQLHVPSNAWGFIPGEAASFCLICAVETANKYKLPVRARLVAISTAHEKNKIKTKTVCIGAGLTQAVQGLLSALPENTKIDYTICDQNGEAYRADEFGFMLARLSKYFADSSDYMAPADCWGDVGAASGPLFVNLIVAASEKGYAKGVHTLLWTSSEGGERTAVLFRAGIEEGGIA